ncbi:MAG TPA: phosphate signaling complex protein PhoU [Tepidisphaeraceae bacterium]|nr:phosphate signaling complex protein PhoU [Tepidisphaeraceae bacterium]
MREAFDQQLQQIMQKIALMGRTAESMVHTAISGLTRRTESVAEEVYAKERQVNALQIEVDELVIKTMIHQQPVARDARLVIIASKAATDLERMGDQAINIIQNTHFVLRSPETKPLVELEMMADGATKMVADALSALVGNDAELAEKVFMDEKKLDALRDEVFRILLRSIITDPLDAQRSLSLILISRNLERIGDHATNIAEEVVYLTRGKDVRHHFDKFSRQ